MSGDVPAVVSVGPGRQERHGAVIPPVVRGDWSPRSGYEAGRVLVGRRGLGAVFVANDQLALGLLRAFAELGRRTFGLLAGEAVASRQLVTRSSSCGEAPAASSAGVSANARVHRESHVVRTHRTWAETLASSSFRTRGRRHGRCGGHRCRASGVG
jgi:hypothetical protein